MGTLWRVKIKLLSQISLFLAGLEIIYQLPVFYPKEDSLRALTGLKNQLYVKFE